MVADECRDDATRAGFQLWAKRREDAADTVTALRIPTGVTDAEIISHMVEKYGILIGGGYKETKGKLLRIGHMGYQATIINVMATIAALERTVREVREKKAIPISVK